MAEEEMQKKYIEYQMLQQQTQQLQQQMQQIDAQIVELNNVVNSLKEFGSSKTGSEILVPLSSGIFAYAEQKDNKNLRVNVGSNVSVKKTVKETQELVKSQMKEIETYRMQMVQKLTEAAAKMQKIEQDLMKIAEKKPN